MAKFISIEGGEGVGKSTALEYLQTLFTNAGIDFIQTREPGGTPISETLRDVVLNNANHALCEDAEFLVVFSARAQHVQEVIRPALAAGTWVLCDRFVDSSFAYQGGGRGYPMDRLNTVSEWVVGDTMPDLTILLDAPVDVGLQRMQERGEKDRIESEDVAFFERVRAQYLERAASDPQRFRIVNVDCAIEDVQCALRGVLAGVL